MFPTLVIALSLLRHVSTHAGAAVYDGCPLGVRPRLALVHNDRTTAKSCSCSMLSEQPRFRTTSLPPPPPRRPWRQVRQAATIARAAWHIGLTTYVPIVSHAGPRHLSKLSPGFHSSIGRQMNAAQMRTNSRHRSGDHSHWPLTEATTNGSAKGLW